MDENSVLYELPQSLAIFCRFQKTWMPADYLSGTLCSRMNAMHDIAIIIIQQWINIAGWMMTLAIKPLKIGRKNRKKYATAIMAEYWSKYEMLERLLWIRESGEGQRVRWDTARRASVSGYNGSINWAPRKQFGSQNLLPAWCRTDNQLPAALDMVLVRYGRCGRQRSYNQRYFGCRSEESVDYW
jgi:hypothetical protein